VRWTALLVVLTVPGHLLAAQSVIHPRWSVAAGPGFVLRTVHSSSPGLNLRGSRIVKLASAVYSEFGVVWHGYLSSDWLSWDEDGKAPCPPGGCNTERARDGITVVGLEVGAAYRKFGADNPIFPVAGAGLYRVSADDTTGTRLGVNLGLVIPFRHSSFGPGLEIRYFRMFGDSRFKSLLPFSIRWSF
jgi:hypothetical protein